MKEKIYMLTESQLMDIIQKCKTESKKMDEGFANDIDEGFMRDLGYNVGRLRNKVDKIVSKLDGATLHVVNGHVEGSTNDGDIIIRMYEYKDGAVGQAVLSAPDFKFTQHDEWEMDCPFTKKEFVDNLGWAVGDIFEMEDSEKGMIATIDSVDGETDQKKWPAWVAKTVRVNISKR